MNKVSCPDTGLIQGKLNGKQMIYCAKIEPVIEGNEDPIRQEIHQLSQQLEKLKEQQMLLQKRM
jgi:hypothetical protein